MGHGLSESKPCPKPCPEREILADPVSAGLLRHSHHWISAGELKKRVARETGISQATIKRRAAELASRGAIERRGAGPRVRYRATGLFDA
jgi:DNA-binding transcriptional MocR family regulator